MSDYHFPTPEQRLAARNRPASSVVMKQRWSHLMFLHWEIEPELVQQILPDGLMVDTFDGKAYLGVVPFFMERIRPVYCPPVPGISWFQELNFRTYVYDTEGRPGVWFLSLDCNQWLAVKMARRFFHLPYQHAVMSASRDDGALIYKSQRKGDDEEQEFRYPDHLDQSREAESGSLEFFLLERYRLYSADRVGRLYEGMVQHLPYRYQEVSVDDFSTRLFSLSGFQEPKVAPISSLIAENVDVDIHPLHALD